MRYPTAFVLVTELDNDHNIYCLQQTQGGGALYNSPNKPSYLKTAGKFIANLHIFRWSPNLHMVKNFRYIKLFNFT